MPRYRTKVDRWLSHESRSVKAGEVFDTVFPKVKDKDGKLVDMKLGENLELVDAKLVPKSNEGGDLAG